MRVRRARSLVIFFRDSRPIVYNFLTRQAFASNTECINILASATDWQAIEVFFTALRSFRGQSVAIELFRLVEQGGLVVEGSTAALQDEAYADTWDWDVAAGFYHFAIKNSTFVGGEQATAWIEQRLQTKGLLPLYTTNDRYPLVTQLSPPVGQPDLFSIMRRRRSARIFGAAPLSRQALGDCLFAGLGITAFIEDSLLGRLPLKMTPSGGARNPYEAYVYARNVHDLDLGIYHYSALEHSLGLVPTIRLPPIKLMLADQDWADDAAAVILLVAHFDRTMWKYGHPGAYRVVLIEAGHIAQNIVLAATAQGLAAGPTAALNDLVVEEALHLTELTQAAIYAVALGSPGAPET